MTDDLQVAAKHMLWVIETLGAIPSMNDGWKRGGWKDYLEPILVDAYEQLKLALEQVDEHPEHEGR